MSTPKTRSKTASGSWEATAAPTSAPSATGTRSGAAPARPGMPCARKPHAATPFWIITPTRLVPLATVPGRPVSTRSGTVRSEPPPARVFTTPAARPPARSSAASPGSMAPLR